MTSQLFEALSNRAYFFGKFRYQIVSLPSRISLRKAAHGGPPYPTVRHALLYHSGPLSTRQPQGAP